MPRVRKWEQAFHEAVMEKVNGNIEVTELDFVREMLGLILGIEGDELAALPLYENQDVEDYFGLEEISVPFAKRGDLVLVGDDGGGTLGIVALDGRNVFIPREGGGLRGVPISQGTQAWGVE